ncbi:TPA: hypothetical protein NQI75_003426 [Pseudomonas aeruginosa]|nr:hypothetical protein [Pseudomonas aeruginosa]HCH7804172.1 hypothetical protein [Pseudomonas aeruginosa]HCI4169437.1 hypothetical protein [Pseudomonas aeruginosa]HCI7166577.1 hypothetical protein [Pseudomonas aeruginosa]HCJ0754682.1 hypothetical protein [Pseudomonas aeruginosa]
MAFSNDRAVRMIEEGITAMRRSHFPRPEQSFLHGQIELAYAVDFIDTRLYDDMRRRLDSAADARQQELRSIDL